MFKCEAASNLVAFKYFKVVESDFGRR